MKGNINFFLAKIWATFFFLGLFPRAPGTVGSLGAVVAYLALLPICDRTLLWIATGGVFLTGWACCSFLVKKLNNSDPQIIVIDEVVGIFITFSMLPLSYMDYPYDLFFMSLGFVMFRIFDILKPFPVFWADSKVKGGLGVMLDDVLAGLYAGFTIWIGIALWNTLKTIF